MIRSHGPSFSPHTPPTSLSSLDSLLHRPLIRRPSRVGRSDASRPTTILAVKTNRCLYNVDRSTGDSNSDGIYRRILLESGTDRSGAIRRLSRLPNIRAANLKFKMEIVPTEFLGNLHPLITTTSSLVVICDADCSSSVDYDNVDQFHVVVR